jgi:hypothetical protein
LAGGSAVIATRLHLWLELYTPRIESMSCPTSLTRALKCLAAWLALVCLYLSAPDHGTVYVSAFRATGDEKLNRLG